MNAVDRKTFFDGYRKDFGALVQSQVDGLSFLLTSLEADANITDVRQAAYMLATTKHETEDKFTPCEEDGKGRGRPYGVPNRKTGLVYYGRGYVQITFYQNYLVMGTNLALDLTRHPELALVPYNAYRIMSLGMRKGMFTGRCLNDYINPTFCDYLHARKIINRLDCAERIAGFAETFEKVLAEAAVIGGDEG